MSAWWKFWERRAVMLDAEAILTRTFGGSDVTADEAMQIPSYAASVAFIAGTVASLPVKLYEERDGQTKEIREDPRLPLLNGYTGDLMDTASMLRGMVADYFNHGAGWAYVERRYNTVTGLHYVSAKDVQVTVRENPIYHDADVYVQGKLYKPFEFLRIVRNTKNGVTGQSIPDQSPVPIAATYAALQYEMSVMRTGGNKKGVLTSERKLDREAMDNLKKAWAELYSTNTSNAIVLNAGVNFKETSDTPVDVQINQNKVTNGGEIARLFLLSPDVIAGGADADKLVSAIRVAVMPIINALQDTFNDILLLTEERNRKYFAFDTSELMRGDVLRRYQAYKIALDANFMQPDEVRYKEDMPALGLNFIKLGLNDVLFDPATKQIYTPNTNKSVKLDGKEVVTDESGDQE